MCCGTLLSISRARTLVFSSIVLIAFKTSLWINDGTRMSIVWPQSTCFGACCFHIPTVIRYADLYTARATSSQKLQRLAQKIQRLEILIRQVDDQLDVVVAGSVKDNDGSIMADEHASLTVVEEESSYTGPSESEQFIVKPPASLVAGGLLKKCKVTRS